MALGQIDLAIELLTDGRPHAEARTVHEIRKALKRLRALLRLLEHELGSKAYARESEALRAIAGRLSGARDAQVMLSTLDALMERHPRKLGRNGGVRRLRKRLRAEHTLMQRRTLGDPGTRAALLAELQALRLRVEAWSLPQRPGMQLVQHDLRRVYGQGRRRYRRVLRGTGEQMVTMHRWRKRVKDLRYAGEMLAGEGSPERLHKLGHRADSLGELLGEDHDLALFAQHLRAGARKHGSRTWRTRRKTRRLLLAAIAKRRRKLRKRALRDGAKLYSRSPKRFMRRLK